jgi:DNA-binding NarL/FixJ family response regulator
VEKTIRVVLVDDNGDARESLRSLVQTMPGVTIVAEAADGDDGKRRMFA